MKYLSVCSGIEAATVAWRPLGWHADAFSEIEQFPCAALAYHYPQVPNRGDMTLFKEWPDAAFDLLVGGTPCQSFSVAGLRKGLDDPRGNLMLTYLAIAARHRPRWLVWENVPGVLSSSEGRDFGALLGGLGQLGYGFAYRVLDAQFFGVPQRRRRVFVVGCLGDWRSAAAVLSERHSMSGHPAPRREAREDLAGTLTSGAGNGAGHRARSGYSKDGTLIASTGHVSHCLNAGGMGRQDYETETMVVQPTVYSIMPMNSGTDYKARVVDVAQPLMAGGPVGGNQGGDFVVTHALTGEGFDASEDGTGRGTPLVPVQVDRFAVLHKKPVDELGFLHNPVAFTSKDFGQDAGYVAPTFGAMQGSHPNAGGQIAIAFDTTQVTSPGNVSNPKAGDPCHPLARWAHAPAIASASAVRRLTPRECERLQGFPDDYTLIPFRGKPAADGNRYKALGNSMAVPVMAWIGERIAMVDALTLKVAA